MKRLLQALSFAFASISALHSIAQDSISVEKVVEPHRPAIHFTPEAMWMNDPNGLVFYKGVYHLFYQHNPNSTVWGPMHWGHATSTDLVHWQRLPIALYPDSLGAIFSGSAVADVKNTSGLGKNGKVPLVAIFTHHDADGERAGKNDFQNQSLAYSLDDGKTWEKYAGNPVLRSPGIRDFRDPKVMWHEQSKKWIMSLAAADKIFFYSSPNLKDWKKESEFGATIGAHGGVWECPDLFQLTLGTKKYWVLIVNLNPGGPNKGSATQYFVGNFDGKTFTPTSTDTKWLDYGPDEYAGITWFNTGERKVFIGWMSNWLYANEVPTQDWRNATTIARELKLVSVKNDLRVVSMPVKELAAIQQKPMVLANVAAGPIELQKKDMSVPALPARIDMDIRQLKNFRITLSNDDNAELAIGFDQEKNEYYIDRTSSGKSDFNKDFAGTFTAPRLTADKNSKLTLVLDVASAELFADGGLTTMTAIFFPNQPYNVIKVSFDNGMVITKLEYRLLKPIF